VPFVPRDDDEIVATYVGRPAGRRWSYAIEPYGGGTPYEGYQCISWGILVPWDWEMDGEPQQWPCWRYIDDDGIAHTYQIWLTQAFKVGSRVTAEQRWHPETGIHESIAGLENQPLPTPEQLAEALRGLSLIRLVQEKRQRKVRPREFELKLAVEAARALLDDHQMPTFELIYDYIENHHEAGLLIDTLKSRWRLRGRGEPPITMAEVLEEAQR
jgi:hypothetical protein